METGKLAIVALALSLFAASALADNVFYSIDYTGPNATILGIAESSSFAYAAQSGSNWMVWYSNAGSGSFDVAANAQDGISGIVNMTWPATTSAGGTNYTANVSDINFIWTYSWDSSDTVSFYGQYVTVHDNASNSNTSWNSFSVILDNAAPTTMDDGPADNVTWHNASVVVNLTAIEGANGSGVNFTAYCIHSAEDLPCDPAAGTVNYAPSQQPNLTTPVSLSCTYVCRYFVRYFSGDNVGNNESVKSSNRINIEIAPFSPAPPLVSLNAPADSAWQPAGNVTFAYTPYDSMSSIVNCSLYIDGALNATNSSPVINGGLNNFTVQLQDEANYTWTVGCTNAEGKSGNATARIIRIDNETPSIYSISVAYPFDWNKTTEGFGILIDVSAGDSGSGVASVVVNCTELGSGLVAATFQSGSPANGVWRASCLATNTTQGFEGNVTAYATVTDGVGFAAMDNAPVALDNRAPDNPAYLDVSGWPADTDGVVNLSWQASASSDVSHYNVYRSNVGNFTPAPGLLVGSTPGTTWADVPPSDGTWYWQITAVDDIGNENLTAAPENSTLVDTGAPSVSNLTLTYPLLAANLAIRQTKVKNGDSLLITAEVSDAQGVDQVWLDISAINSSLGNVSMVYNLTGDGTYGYSATVGGTSGDADQIIRIYANDTSGNLRNGVAALVAVDNLDPSITISDDGNFTSITTSIHARWNFSDADSAALGYLYTVYDSLGNTVANWTWTTLTDVTQGASPPLSEGMTYFWYVYAYDEGGNNASATTAPEGITVDTTPPDFLYVSDEGDATNSTTQLNASWLAQDLDSGVRRYFYRIGEDNNNDGVVDAWFRYNTSDGVWRFAAGNNTTAWVDVGGNTSVSAAIDSMTYGRMYYFEVKAENWAGVAALDRSDGILATNITANVTANASLTVVPNSTYVSVSGVSYTPSCTGNASTCTTWVRYNYSSWSQISSSQGAQSYTMTGDGVYEFLVNGTDASNGTFSSGVVWVGRDTVAPNTTVAAQNVTGADALAAYVNAPIVVNLTAIDLNPYGVNVSGVAAINRSLNSSPWTAAAGNFTTFNVTSAGTLPLRFYSRDNTGNAEATKTATILAMENSYYDSGTTITNCTLINSTIINSTLQNCTIINSNVTNGIVKHSELGNSTVNSSTVEWIEAKNATIVSGQLTSGYVRCISNGYTYTAPPSKALGDICAPPAPTPAPRRPSAGPAISPYAVETSIISRIEAGGCANATFILFAKHGVKAITVCASRLATNVTVRVAERGQLSPPPLDATYLYIDITAYNISDKDITSVAHYIVVPKSWIVNASVDYRRINMYRWQDAGWQELPTEWLASDSDYQHYRASSPGLSVFAIAGPIATCPASCPEPGLWGACTEGIASRTEYVCDAETGFDCGPRVVTKACAPELLCPICPEPSEWGVCAEGVQARTEYACSAETGYACSPVVAIRACEIPAACPACPEPWEWSECTNGTRARWSYRCGPDTGYTCVRYEERETCLPLADFAYMLAGLIAFVVFVLIIAHKRRAIARRLDAVAEMVGYRARAIRRWLGRLGEEAELKVPEIRMPEARPKPPAMAAKVVKPKGPSLVARLRKALRPKPKPRVPEARVPAAPPAPAEVPAAPPALPPLPPVKPRLLRAPGKPRYVCSVCGKPEMLIHWCESCGQEVCIEHIHRVGTKLYCDTCMKKKRLM
ncbi:MAG: PGF-pre-PGF domain-containing protein [Candidatus Aenigmatarchaeota archaeon]